MGVPDGKNSILDLVSRAKETWPEWEGEQPLLLLEQDGGAWRGVVKDRAGVALTVLFDETIGLRNAASA